MTDTAALPDYAPVPAAMKPSPPASATAAVSSGVDEPPASGAPTSGISINELKASVFMIAGDEPEHKPPAPRSNQSQSPTCHAPS